jgi:serine protease Do
MQDGARSLSTGFREVARRISPSVVGVVAIHEAREAPAGFQQGGPDLFFRDPFHRFLAPQDPDGDDDGYGMPMPFPSPRGQGTGVIVDESGTIATNNHVVAGAERIQVKLQDGRTLSAELVGADPDTDLAILRVHADGLTAARLGDSDALEPGDWVMAVGNPFGLDHTVTVGVVSAKGRTGVGVATYEDFIQTDAAINPGNSGGPLVNLEGEVVGINTAIRTSNGGSDGISFAIPSSTLKSVMPELVSAGRVSRGWIGVAIQDVTPELAESFGTTAHEGALVSQVVEDSPAQRAGLRSGDIVLQVDDKRVKSASQLSTLVAGLEPGTDVELTVLRNGKHENIKLELAEREPDSGDRGRADEGAERTPARWGLRLGPVPEDLASALDVEHGALIRRVEPGSAAEDAGLSPGEVIVSVNDREVRDADDALDALRSVDHAKGVRLLVRSRAGSHWVYLSARSSE